MKDLNEKKVKNSKFHTQVVHELKQILKTHDYVKLGGYVEAARYCDIDLYISLSDHEKAKLFLATLLRSDLSYCKDLVSSGTVTESVLSIYTDFFADNNDNLLYAVMILEGITRNTLSLDKLDWLVNDLNLDIMDGNFNVINLLLHEINLQKENSSCYFNIPFNEKIFKIFLKNNPHCFECNNIDNSNLLSPLKNLLDNLINNNNADKYKQIIAFLIRYYHEHPQLEELADTKIVATDSGNIPESIFDPDTNDVLTVFDYLASYSLNFDDIFDRDLTDTVLGSSIDGSDSDISDS